MTLVRQVAAGLLVAAGAARAQPASPPPAAPGPTPPQAAVIRPQPNIDPGMRVTPKRDLRLPTPVIKPHPDQGSTVVVPK